MYYVYWKTKTTSWKELYRNYDFPTTKNWALQHISYTGDSVLKVEIRDEEGCCEIIYNNTQ